MYPRIVGGESWRTDAGELAALGFDAARRHEAEAAADDDQEPTRVLAEHRGMYVVAGADGECKAEPIGRLRREATSREELPVVGDWVLIRRPGGGRALVTTILPRRSLLARVEPGGAGRLQPLAANVDVVFVVSALDQRVNPLHIERYLSLARDSGARPVVVLSKSDLCSALAERMAEIRAIAPAETVLAISARSDVGIEPVEGVLGRGLTAVLLGSSGAGKSTLLNRLLGTDTARTQEVRAHDGKGRHTTSHRELHRLLGGALLIDTPGLRELEVTVDPKQLEVEFADLLVLGENCRFGDCRHDGEPGCAVAAAIAAGQIEPQRLASMHQLAGEIAHSERQSDARAEAVDRKRARTTRHNQSERQRRRRE